MSDKEENSDANYEAQLSALESRIVSHAGEETLLGDVGLAMRNLLSGSAETETHIRQIMQRQYEQGNLRRESYELVETLLDKISKEESFTTTDVLDPGEPDTDLQLADAEYAKTTVLEPKDAVKPVPEPEPPTTNQLQLGSVLRDRFLLKEQVAEGSMGVVYKALDRRLAETGEEEAHVAIKVLSPKLAHNGIALRALQQEAAKGRCLTHPNIVRFIDLDRDGGLYFIVMEWLNGQSLSSILDDKRGEVIDPQRAMAIVQQVADALEYAHQRGVIHADVKPGNIIVTPEGQVKLIDFGVARIRQKENLGRSRLDPDVIRAGTPAYSSMQVLTGEDPVPADDVFSLACLAYRLVAGYRVYGPRNAAQAAEEGMEPQQPPGLDAAEWQVLKKALSYSRVTRYPTPKQFMNALAVVEPEPELRPQPKAPATPVTAAARDASVHAMREPIMYEREEQQRRSPWRLVFIGLIIIGSVAVIIETDLVDQIADLDLPGIARSVIEGPVPDEPNPDEQILTLDPLPEIDVADTVATTATDNVVEELIIDDSSVSQIDAVAVAVDAGQGPEAVDPEPESTPEPEVQLIDFSLLPEPNLLLSLADNGSETVPESELVIRENGPDVIVDLVRTGDLSEAFAVQFVETEVSGNQSAWESGQYGLESDGLLEFGPGQPRARMSISMLSDPVREPDREITLSVRPTGEQQSELAVIKLTLEDDDQRAFEERLPPNTVAFAVNQVSVREFDPAVQVDVVRYKPDNSPLEVSYTLQDVTATEGQDYFAPAISSVYFEPGQRAARILIPLGQDSRSEQDEAFMLRLNTESAPADSNIFSQIAVMIRDDDS